MELTTPRSDLHEVILNDYIAYSDFAFPNLENMTSEVFPNQEESMIGKVIRLWYMTEKYHIQESGLFTVVRWDSVYPNRVILVNDKMNMVIVSKPEFVMEDSAGEEDEDGHPVANAHIHPYPIQRYDLLGTETIDGYMKDLKKNHGYIIRADAGGDKVEFVIAEELPDGTKRVVTLEETKAVCQLGDIHEKTPQEFANIWGLALEGVDR